MTTKERINDIFETGMFNDSEIELMNNDSYIVNFKTWEYYQVFHLTNSELYYLSDEETESLESSADETIETKQGIIYCYK